MHKHTFPSHTRPSLLFIFLFSHLQRDTKMRVSCQVRLAALKADEFVSTHRVFIIENLVHFGYCEYACNIWYVLTMFALLFARDTRVSGGGGVTCSNGEDNDFLFSPCTSTISFQFVRYCCLFFSVARRALIVAIENKQKFNFSRDSVARTRDCRIFKYRSGTRSSRRYSNHFFSFCCITTTPFMMLGKHVPYLLRVARASPPIFPYCGTKCGQNVYTRTNCTAGVDTWEFSFSSEIIPSPLLFLFIVSNRLVAYGLLAHAFT